MDRLDFLAVQGTLKSLLQHHSSKASVIWSSAFFLVQLSHPYMTTEKTIPLTTQTFVGKVNPTPPPPNTAISPGILHRQAGMTKRSQAGSGLHRSQPPHSSPQSPGLPAPTSCACGSERPWGIGPSHGDPQVPFLQAPAKMQN